MSAEVDIEVPSAPKRGKTLPLVLGLNTLLLAGVMVFLFKRPAVGGGAPAASTPAAEHEEKPSGHPEEEAAGPTVKLDNFIIQLKTVDADRYVRVAFDLEVGNEADKSVVQARMSPIRDAVITFFADRTLDELRGGEAIAQTKLTLAKRLKEIVPGNRIRAVYITDFVVQ